MVEGEAVSSSITKNCLVFFFFFVDDCPDPWDRSPHVQHVPKVTKLFFYFVKCIGTGNCTEWDMLSLTGPI